MEAGFWYGFQVEMRDDVVGDLGEGRARQGAPGAPASRGDAMFHAGLCWMEKGSLLLPELMALVARLAIAMAMNDVNGAAAISKDAKQAPVQCTPILRPAIPIPPVQYSNIVIFYE